MECRPFPLTSPANNVRRFQVETSPKEQFYFSVFVEPSATDDCGSWSVEQISKHKFVYGTEESEEGGEDAPDDEPIESHFILPAVPL